MIDLVVTDLDGTLWGPDEVVHPETLRALDDLGRRSIPVLIATGRSRRSAYGVLGQHDISLDAALHDGALGATTAGDVFHHHPFDRESLERLLGALAAMGLEPILEVDDPDVDFLAGDNPSIQQPQTRPWRTVDLGADLPMPVYRAIAVVEPARVEAVMTSVLGSGAADAWAAPSMTGSAFYLIARPASCSKWSATLSYCQRIGVDPARVLAIGDGNNDRELLANAGISVAVEGGSQTALELADHVVGPPGDGGWAALLDWL